jgi:chromate transport protein ChrA
MGSSEVSPSPDAISSNPTGPAVLTLERTNAHFTANDSATDKLTMDDVETPSTTPVDGVVSSSDPESEKTADGESKQDRPLIHRLWEVLKSFWILGLIGFGGPQAHIAIFRDHLILKRSWIDEDSFIQLYAIGQALPGPTSTLHLISLGMVRAGPLGGLLAFFLLSIPNFIILTVCGILIGAYIDPKNPPFYLVGLPPAAISLIFTAFHGFCTKVGQVWFFSRLGFGVYCHSNQW